ncbi:MAG: BLUF domain-containing protein, partial [Comamonadaceae bacterium]
RIADCPLGVSDIFEHARPANAVLGITGGLVVLDQVFLQYLEGEESVVDAMFSKILTDPRHSDVKLLERRDIRLRAFRGWRMGLLRWNPASKAIFYSFSPGARLDLYATDPSTAAPLFRALAKAKCWLDD